MPLPGTSVTNAARSTAMRAIEATFERASWWADGLGDKQLLAIARKPFEIAEISRSEFDTFVNKFRDVVVWTDEGNCFNRAQLGAHMLNRQTSIGWSPLDDTFAGAIAVSAYRHEGGAYVGSFHSKLAVRIKGMDEVQVVDLLEPNPVLQPISTWNPGNPPMLLRPHSGTGLPFVDGGTRALYTNRIGLTFGASNLLDTWRRAEEFGVKVTGPKAQV